MNLYQHLFIVTILLSLFVVIKTSPYSLASSLATVVYTFAAGGYALYFVAEFFMYLGGLK